MLALSSSHIRVDSLGKKTAVRGPSRIPSFLMASRVNGSRPLQSAKTWRSPSQLRTGERRPQTTVQAREGFLKARDLRRGLEERLDFEADLGLEERGDLAAN